MTGNAEREGSDESGGRDNGSIDAGETDRKCVTSRSERRVATSVGSIGKSLFIIVS